MTECLLSEAEIGRTYLIDQIWIEGSDRFRLEEMGISCGEAIVCLCAAPLGSPLLFWINDAMIALRKTECMKIKVTCFVPQ